jgi:uncharacterized protein YoxC
MSDLLQADIFFFITTIAVILSAVLFAVLLVYLIKFLRDAKEISHRVKKEIVGLADDLTDLRENLREHGSKLSDLAQAVSSFGRGKKSTRKSKK